MSKNHLIHILLIFIFFFSSFHQIIDIQSIHDEGIVQNNSFFHLLQQIMEKISEKKDTNTHLSSESNLDIVKINGGTSLSFNLRNTGSETMHNVTISVTTHVGIGSFIDQESYNSHVPSLSPGQTKEFHIRYKGFCIPLILNNQKNHQDAVPMFNITIYSDGTLIIEKKAAFTLLGSSINILGVFFNAEEAYEGYTLFSPDLSNKAFLMDNNGTIHHTWENINFQSHGCYLDTTGNIILTNLDYTIPPTVSGGMTGRCVIIDPENDVVWENDFSNNSYYLHHDIEMLPNGNILMIAWEKISKTALIKAGYNPASFITNSIWSDCIIEVRPIHTSDYEIVWKWRAWDHLIQDHDPTRDNYGVIQDHPELIDLNFLQGDLNSDWLHINSLDYHQGLDQILISVRNFDEIWIIDHSTTTKQAAGHTGGRYGKGGDLLYRWGNPQAYDRGDENDQQLFRQHDANWISSDCPGEENILVFNNRLGDNDPSGLLSIVEFSPEMNSSGGYILEDNTCYGPEKLSWEYQCYSYAEFEHLTMGSAQRLPNGNTLICVGPVGDFFEVTPEKKVVWRYKNLYPSTIPNRMSRTFLIRRYSDEYTGIMQLFQ